MLITEKLLPLSYYEINSRSVDWLVLEWFETNKRILHKTTTSGREVTMKFLQANQNLAQDDVLYEDAETIIAVEIAACDAIVVKPKNGYEMAAICYEIGNRHVPLFFENNELLVPFEVPLFSVLQKAGYEVQEGKRKLLTPLKTTVLPHGGGSLFSKDMTFSIADR
ncbi:MAG: urease accessory protein UreE [Bacteroidota bacterium]